MQLRQATHSVLGKVKGALCRLGLRPSAQQMSVQIVEATRQADIQTLNKLKAKRYQFELLESLYGTVLHSAYRLSDGHLDVMRFYLGLFPDMHVRDRSQHTLMDTAVIEGRLDLCRLLVTHGFQLQATDETAHSTPIQKAIRYHQEQILVYFLTYLNNHDELRPLITDVLKEAVVEDRLETVNLLLDYELDVNRCYEHQANVLHFVKSVHIMEKLIHRGFDINQLDDCGVSVIAKVILENNLELSRCVLKYQPDLNQGVSEFANLVMAAAKNNNLDLIKALFAQEPLTPNASDESNFRTWLIGYCVEDRCSLEIMRYLLKQGCKIDGGNARLETPLMIAAQNNNQYYLRFLLKMDANVNAVDAQGKNALMHAVMSQSEKCVMPLMSHTSNLFLEDSQGHDVVWYCAAYGSELIAKFLVAKGVSFNYVDFNKQTSLMVAAEHNNVDMVNMLVQTGVPIDSVDKQGRTALMYAAIAGAQEAVVALIQHGCDINRADQTGMTASALAQNAGTQSCIRLGRVQATVPRPALATTAAKETGLHPNN